MASRSKNSHDEEQRGKAQGFQIPIEDGDEVKEEAAAQEAASAVEEPEAVEAEVLEPESAPESEPETTEGDTETATDSADDLVAEAEAVVAEAAEKQAAEDVAAQLEEARAQATEWQDRYMRLHAEWDTYRRRTSEQRAEEKARATEKLVEDLLPVLDDFERSVDYAEKNGETGLLEGVRAVQTKLLSVLTKSGVEIIDPAGEPFDALAEQAVGTVPDEEAYDETVRDVYQKGYRMGKKVLRPAMVTITTGGPARPKEE